MGSGIKAPVWSYDGLRDEARKFLKQFHPSNSLPIPIEEIVDLQMQITICPLAGIQNNCETDAFVNSDCSAIYVDSQVYLASPNRFRFSLAHEAAHVLLHRSIMKLLKFQSIQEWRQACASIPEAEYQWLEWQAYALAGLILVPPNGLKKRFTQSEAAVKEMTQTTTPPEAVRHAVESLLASQYEVSREVIQKRCVYDGI